MLMVREKPSLHQLLETGKPVVVKIYSKPPLLNVPNHIKDKGDFFFIKIGKSNDVFTQGLKIIPTGFHCRLVFSGVESECFVPWGAVEKYSGEAVVEYNAAKRRKMMKAIDGSGSCGKIVERKLTLVSHE